jgi:hypothetical protein
LQTKSVSDFFNDTPLSSLSAGRWLDLRNKGSLSMYSGVSGEKVGSRQLAEGERRLVADLPLPAACTLLRVGGAGADIYIVGARPEAVHSAYHNEPMAYILHKANTAVTVYRATKVTAASGAIGSVSWAAIQSTYCNPVYRESPDDRLVHDTVYAGYDVILPSDCGVTSEDELRTARDTFTVKSVRRLNEAFVATCHRKSPQT